MSFNLLTNLQGVNRMLRQRLGSLGGVKSPEMLEMAKVLRKHMRRVLSVPGGGVPAPPGSPPRKQTGALAGSVAQGIVGYTRRVAATWFTAPFLEAGVDAVAGTVKFRKTGRRKGQRAGTVKRTIKIAARPFLQRSIEEAQQEMGDAFTATAAIHLGGEG